MATNVILTSASNSGLVIRNDIQTCRIVSKWKKESDTLYSATGRISMSDGSMTGIGFKILYETSTEPTASIGSTITVTYKNGAYRVVEVNSVDEINKTGELGVYLRADSTADTKLDSDTDSLIIDTATLSASMSNVTESDGTNIVDSSTRGVTLGLSDSVKAQLAKIKVYSAGTGIAVSNGVISGSYTAGAGVDISNGVISGAYTAGEGIAISNGSISSTVTQTTITGGDKINVTATGSNYEIGLNSDALPTIKAGDGVDVAYDSTDNAYTITNTRTTPTTSDSGSNIKLIQGSGITLSSAEESGVIKYTIGLDSSAIPTNVVLKNKTGILLDTATTAEGATEYTIGLDTTATTAGITLETVEGSALTLDTTEDSEITKYTFGLNVSSIPSVTVAKDTGITLQELTSGNVTTYKVGLDTTVIPQVDFKNESGITLSKSIVNNTTTYTLGLDSSKIPETVTLSGGDGVTITPTTNNNVTNYAISLENTSSPVRVEQGDGIIISANTEEGENSSTLVYTVKLDDSKLPSKTEVVSGAGVKVTSATTASGSTAYTVTLDKTTLPNETKLAADTNNKGITLSSATSSDVTTYTIGFDSSVIPTVAISGGTGIEVKPSSTETGSSYAFAVKLEDIPSTTLVKGSGVTLDTTTTGQNTSYTIGIDTSDAIFDSIKNANVVTTDKTYLLKSEENVISWRGFYFGSGADRVKRLNIGDGLTSQVSSTTATISLDTSALPDTPIFEDSSTIKVTQTLDTANSKTIYKFNLDSTALPSYTATVVTGDSFIGATFDNEHTYTLDFKGIYIGSGSSQATRLQAGLGLTLTTDSNIGTFTWSGLTIQNSSGVALGSTANVLKPGAGLSIGVSDGVATISYTGEGIDGGLTAISMSAVSPYLTAIGSSPNYTYRWNGFLADSDTELAQRLNMGTGLSLTRSSETNNSITTSIATISWQGFLANSASVYATRLNAGEGLAITTSSGVATVEWSGITVGTSKYTTLKAGDGIVLESDNGALLIKSNVTSGISGVTITGDETISVSGSTDSFQLSWSPESVAVLTSAELSKNVVTGLSTSATNVITGISDTTTSSQFLIASGSSGVLTKTVATSYNGNHGTTDVISNVSVLDTNVVTGIGNNANVVTNIATTNTTYDAITCSGSVSKLATFMGQTAVKVLTEMPTQTTATVLTATKTDESADISVDSVPTVLSTGVATALTSLPTPTTASTLSFSKNISNFVKCYVPNAKETVLTGFNAPETVSAVTGVESVEVNKGYTATKASISDVFSSTSATGLTNVPNLTTTDVVTGFTPTTQNVIRLVGAQNGTALKNVPALQTTTLDTETTAVMTGLGTPTTVAVPSYIPQLSIAAITRANVLNNVPALATTSITLPSGSGSAITSITPSTTTAVTAIPKLTTANIPIPTVVKKSVVTGINWNITTDQSTIPEGATSFPIVTSINCASNKVTATYAYLYIVATTEEVNVITSTSNTQVATGYSSTETYANASTTNVVASITTENSNFSTIGSDSVNVVTGYDSTAYTGSLPDGITTENVLIHKSITGVATGYRKDTAYSSAATTDVVIGYSAPETISAVTSLANSELSLVTGYASTGYDGSLPSDISTAVVTAVKPSTSTVVTGLTPTTATAVTGYDYTAYTGTLPADITANFLQTVSGDNTQEVVTDIVSTGVVNVANAENLTKTDVTPALSATNFTTGEVLSTSTTGTTTMVGTAGSFKTIQSITELPVTEANKGTFLVGNTDATPVSVLQATNATITTGMAITGFGEETKTNVIGIPDSPVKKGAIVTGVDNSVQVQKEKVIKSASPTLSAISTSSLTDLVTSNSTSVISSVAPLSTTSVLDPSNIKTGTGVTSIGTVTNASLITEKVKITGGSVKVAKAPTNATVDDTEILPE